VQTNCVVESSIIHGRESILKLTRSLATFIFVQPESSTAIFPYVLNSWISLEYPVRMEIDSPKSDLFSVPTLLMQLVCHAPKIFGSANKHFLDKIPMMPRTTKGYCFTSNEQNEQSASYRYVLPRCVTYEKKRKDECQTKTKQSSRIKQIAFRIKAFYPGLLLFILIQIAFASMQTYTNAVHYVDNC